MVALKSAFLLVAVTLVLVDATPGTKTKKAPRGTHEEDVFSDEHYKDGHHETDYDHKAFLGDEQAKEYESLSPKETKKKLKGLFPKIDINSDKKVSLKELSDWIEVNMKKHVQKNTDSRMEEMDTNKDGKISWDEYTASEYSPEQEKGMKKEEVEDQHKMKERDQKRWGFADTDNDNHLTRDELAMMLHPEEDNRMTNVLVEENLEMLDKDKDGKINFEEYAGAGTDEKQEQDDETMKAMRDNFNSDLDKDKDGVLNKEELKQWIMPGSSESPSQSEAQHLMTEADQNKDNFLTLKEVLQNYELFGGSRATNYGEMLREDL